MLKTNPPTFFEGFPQTESMLDGYDPEDPRSAFEQKFGMAFYEFIDQHPQHEAVWRTRLHMSEWSLPYSLVTTQLYWPANGTVCDIGGNKGRFLDELMTQRADLLIQPTLFESFTDIENPILETGDFLRYIPRNQDVYVINRTLHNFPFVQQVTILERIRESAHPRSMVHIGEETLWEGKHGPQRALEQDFRMKLIFGLDRFQPTMNDLTNLLEESGWEPLPPADFTGFTVVRGVIPR